MSSIETRLHPAVREWFLSRFEGFTAIQKSALPHTLAGENTLILAPTGSGKTLAAFLSMLSSLAADAEAKGLPNSVCAVYVSPLKALDRDIHRNLLPPLDAINSRLRSGAKSAWRCGRATRTSANGRGSSGSGRISCSPRRKA